MRRVAALLCALAFAAGVAAADDKSAALHVVQTLPLMPGGSEEDMQVMPMTTALPWGAVGFLDNGCTAALIDNQHVLAASHCFTKDGPGTWQTGLVYFPNYHPDRANPPRVTVDRAVVGSRVQSPGLSSDWGIGHLAGIVTDFPSLAIQPLAAYPNLVSFAGYARDPGFFPKKFPQPSPGGFCPNFEINCWWTPALIDAKCLALRNDGGIVTTDEFSCLSEGGNSGSPVIWSEGSGAGTVYHLTGVISGLGSFWNATRFQWAPRFAFDVTLGPRDDGVPGAQLFAVDSDFNRVVSRSRGTSGAFDNFQKIGDVAFAAHLTSFRLDSGRPQLVVSTRSGLRTSFVGSDGKWQPWSSIAPPAGVTRFLDVAATSDAAHRPQLFAVGSDHALYTTRATSAAAGAVWGPWQTLATGNAARVSAVRHGDGRQQVFFVTADGGLRAVAETSTGAWGPPIFFGTPATLADVSAALTTDGHVQLFALDTTGNGWTRTASAFSSTGGWSPWTSWSVPLDTPAASPPTALDGLVSITASRWQESGTTGIPVVFALDKQGNAYVTTFEGGSWKRWRSFYN